ncbi:hypothetical protein EV121DRAFT_273398 [Schizophyllum commune]
MRRCNLNTATLPGPAAPATPQLSRTNALRYFPSSSSSRLCFAAAADVSIDANDHRVKANQCKPTRRRLPTSTRATSRRALMSPYRPRTSSSSVLWSGTGRGVQERVRGNAGTHRLRHRHWLAARHSDARPLALGTQRDSERRLYQTAERTSSIASGSRRNTPIPLRTRNATLAFILIPRRAARNAARDWSRSREKYEFDMFVTWLNHGWAAGRGITKRIVRGDREAEIDERKPVLLLKYMNKNLIEMSSRQRFMLLSFNSTTRCCTQTFPASQTLLVRDAVPQCGIVSSAVGCANQASQAFITSRLYYTLIALGAEMRRHVPEDEGTRVAVCSSPSARHLVRAGILHSHSNDAYYVLRASCESEGPEAPHELNDFQAGPCPSSGKPIVEVASVFLYRGKLTNFGNAFEITREPNREVALENGAQVGALQLKESSERDGDRHPLLAGADFIFRTSFSDMEVSGEMLIRNQFKALVKVGIMLLKSDECKDNSAVAYLQRHGKVIKAQTSKEVHSSLPPSQAKGLQCLQTHRFVPAFLALLRAILWSSTGRPKHVLLYDVSFVGSVLPGDSLKVNIRHVATRDSDLVVDILSSRPSHIGCVNTHWLANSGFSIVCIVENNPQENTISIVGITRQTIRQRQVHIAHYTTKKGENVESLTLFAGDDVGTAKYTFSHPNDPLFATQFSQVALVVAEEGDIDDSSATYNASNYALCTFNPSRILRVFSDVALGDAVDGKASSPNRLLEIVKSNVETLAKVLHYLKVKKVDISQLTQRFSVMETLGEIIKTSTTPPSRSRRATGASSSSVTSRRSLLLASTCISTPNTFEHAHLNPDVLPFDVSREYAQIISDCATSPRLDNVLKNWEKEWGSSAIRMELLVYQFALPVRWVETQGLLFNDFAFEHLVEFGPGPTLIDMATRTLKAKYEASNDGVGRKRAILIKPSNRRRSTPAREAPSAPSAAPVPAAAPDPVTALSGPVASVRDVPIMPVDNLQKTVDEKPLSKSIKGLVGCKSNLQNQILGDLQLEFSSALEKGGGLPLGKLGSSLQPSGLGKHTSGLRASISFAAPGAASGGGGRGAGPTIKGEEINECQAEQRDAQYIELNMRYLGRESRANEIAFDLEKANSQALQAYRLTTVDREVSARCNRLLGRADLQLITYMQYYIDKFTFPIVPHTEVTAKGDIVSTEVVRALYFGEAATRHCPVAEDAHQGLVRRCRALAPQRIGFSAPSRHAPYASLVLAVSSKISAASSSTIHAPLSYPKRRAGLTREYGGNLTGVYLDVLHDIATPGMTFKDKNLLTGVGKGSIGAEVVTGLVRRRSTVEYYQESPDIPCTRLRPQSRSLQQGLQVEALADYVYAKLGLDLDNLLSFSELVHRIMLVDLLRILGAAKSSLQFVTRPTQVILPLCPNDGLFVNDGFYSKSKISLRKLFQRWASESWGESVCLAGSVIGPRAGSYGMRTFSMKEMALDILDLMHPLLRSITQVGPSWADLHSGMNRLPNFAEDQDAHQPHEGGRTITPDTSAEPFLERVVALLEQRDFGPAPLSQLLAVLVRLTKHNNKWAETIAGHASLLSNVMPFYHLASVAPGEDNCQDRKRRWGCHVSAAAYISKAPKCTVVPTPPTLHLSSPKPAFVKHPTTIRFSHLNERRTPGPRVRNPYHRVLDRRISSAEQDGYCTARLCEDSRGGLSAEKPTFMQMRHVPPPLATLATAILSPSGDQDRAGRDGGPRRPKLGIVFALLATQDEEPDTPVQESSIRDTAHASHVDFEDSGIAIPSSSTHYSHLHSICGLPSSCSPRVAPCRHVIPGEAIRFDKG